MPSFHKDNHIELYNKDCRQMSELADNSVQCVVTSPPYWGLRKYSGEQELIWGGKKDCEHQWVDAVKPDDAGQGHYTGRTRWQHIAQEAQDKGIPVREVDPSAWAKGGFKSGCCSLCGAWKGAYGLEPTPEMYVQHTIEILGEIKRVLRKDGVVFWNIGDSYNGSWADYSGKGRTAISHWSRKAYGNNNPERPSSSYPHSVLKPKDLCLIPFRIAIAAQEDGWWVRSVIIWSKPNPMPESVTDRPTESHEYILMLTKNSRYYWDADAVRMPIAESTIGRGEVDFGGAKGRDYQPTADDPNYRAGSEQWGRTYKYNGGGRNIRTVWEFPTQPFPAAHFAVFPEKLPELCIKAATPEVGCCSKCGAPWERMVEKIPQNVRSHKLVKGKVKDAVDGNNPDMAVGGGFSRTGVQFEWEVKTLGWQPTCKCNADKVPSIVLDPFAGAGTTLWVAKKLNRRAVGYEISQEYCRLALERNRQQVLL